MVQTDDFQEITLSVAISHYLYSCFQGEIAKQRARTRLGLTVNQEELEKIEATVEDFIEWAKEASKGNVLFKKDWDRPKTVAAKRAVRYLEWIRARHLDDVRQIEYLLTDFENRAVVEESFKEMISLSLKRIYTVDNFRLFDYFVQGVEAPESEFNPLIDITSKMIVNFHNYFPPTDTVKNAIREELALSKCHLKVYANDASLKLCLFKPFTFESSLINPSEFENWRKAGFDPLSASVWHCYEFTAESALTWIGYGFVNPAVAWLWRFMGFQPFEAKDWAATGVDPKTARVLANQGLNPDTAINQDENLTEVANTDHPTATSSNDEISGQSSKEQSETIKNSHVSAFQNGDLNTPQLTSQDVENLNNLPPTGKQRTKNSAKQQRKSEKTNS